MSDPKFLRAQARLCLEIMRSLAPDATPAALAAIAELQAMAAELNQHADAMDPPKRNGTPHPIA
jgi:hypothetical protein